MNLIMDFTHTYTSDWIASHDTFTYIDCSDISGTDMYCTKEAEEEILARIINITEADFNKAKDGRMAASGIHFIDSGNYHYVTGIFTKLINEPYNLLFFDNHTDMKPTLIPELLSCGAWAERVLKTEQNLDHMIMIGPGHDDIAEAVCINTSDRLVCISGEKLIGAGMSKLNELLEQFVKAVDMSLPLYISIDKDILSGEYARTNWNQGEMSLDTLEEMLRYFYKRLDESGGKVIGVDICGELPVKDSSFIESSEADTINRKTNDELINLHKHYCCDRIG